MKIKFVDEFNVSKICLEFLRKKVLKCLFVTSVVRSVCEDYVQQVKSTPILWVM
jgi:hypothetical protein